MRETEVERVPFCERTEIERDMFIVLTMLKLPRLSMAAGAGIKSGREGVGVKE